MTNEVQQLNNALSRGRLLVEAAEKVLSKSVMYEENGETYGLVAWDVLEELQKAKRKYQDPLQ